MTSEKLSRIAERMTRATDVPAEEAALMENGNEDRAYRNDDHGVYAVFDGVGGVAGGRIAATRAVDTLRESVQEMPAELSLSSTRDRAAAMLHGVFARASDAIATEQTRALRDAQRARRRGDDLRAEQWEDEARMATTAVVVHILRDTVTKEPHEALIAHLGDSRAYVLRGGDIVWKTTDHSAIQDRIDDGALPPAADQVGDPRVDTTLTRDHRDEVLHARNRITAAIDGSGTAATIDRVPLAAGDILLLTTDGVHDNLTDREIAVLASPYANNPDAVARVLHEEARKRAIEDYERRPDAHVRAKDDDITAVAVRINIAQPRASFSRGGDATRKS